MKTIWKFEAPLTGVFSLEMPKGAEILSFQGQKDKLCIWAIVETDAQIERRRFCIGGTGYWLPENFGRYIGTTQTHGGDLVWHLFECSKEGEASPEVKRYALQELKALGKEFTRIILDGKEGDPWFAPYGCAIRHFLTWLEEREED